MFVYAPHTACFTMYKQENGLIVLNNTTLTKVTGHVQEDYWTLGNTVKCIDSQCWLIQSIRGLANIMN